MKQITPYSTTREAMASLDNGGRFYNILTEAEDGKIATAELGKVGGLFNDRQKMILYLEMAVCRLDPAAKAKVMTSLEAPLMESYHKYRAQKLLPSEAQEKGIVSRNAIITGIPTKVESKKEFKGFILIPVMAGKVMTLIPIPIVDQYDVYEVRDERYSETFLVAHAREKQKLPDGEKIIMGGVLKELKADKDEKKASMKFLEVNYFLSS